MKHKDCSKNDKIHFSCVEFILNSTNACAHEDVEYMYSTKVTVNIHCWAPSPQLLLVTFHH